MSFRLIFSWRWELNCNSVALAVQPIKWIVIDGDDVSCSRLQPIHCPQRFEEQVCRLYSLRRSLHYVLYKLKHTCRYAADALRPPISPKPLSCRMVAGGRRLGTLVFWRQNFNQIIIFRSGVFIHPAIWPRPSSMPLSRFVTIYTGRKLGASPRGSVSFLGRGLGPHVTQSPLGGGLYLRAKWHLDASSRLATIR